MEESESNYHHIGGTVINNFEYFKSKLIEITINNAILNLNFTGNW